MWWINLFSAILFLENYHPVKTFEDLSGIIKTSPISGVTVVASMFAMCGLPPFGNFIAKINIFKLFLSNRDYIILVFGILYSVISIVYLIKWSRYFFYSSKSININNNTHSILAIFLFVILMITIIFYEPIFIYFNTIFTLK